MYCVKDKIVPGGGGGGGGGICGYLASSQVTCKEKILPYVFYKFYMASGYAESFNNDILIGCLCIYDYQYTDHVMEASVIKEFHLKPYQLKSPTNEDQRRISED